MDGWIMNPRRHMAYGIRHTIYGIRHGATRYIFRGRVRIEVARKNGTEAGHGGSCVLPLPYGPGTEVEPCVVVLT